MRLSCVGLAMSLTILSGGCEAVLGDGPAGPRGRSPLCRGDVCPELPPPASRLPRLSHPQWENATRDLLGLEEPSGLSSTFIGDATSSIFDNDGDELSVGGSLWSDYQRTSEALAERVATEPGRLDALVPSDAPASGEARARAFVESLGLGAHRRPLTDDERDAYLTLFAEGATLYPEHDAFTGGARLVIEAMLQSPHFLYRVELADEQRGGMIHLDGYALASRLSFALWNTMPDAELFRAARDGDLSSPEGLMAQAERMLMDRRAEIMVRAFHHQLLEVGRVGDVSRSTTLFPEFSTEVRTSAQAEVHRFVEHVVFETDGGLRELLTAPYTFVDEHLAPIYGVDAPGEGFARVEFAPDRRAGLLTQVGFLTVNSSSTEPDAIHRGVFVNERLLCAHLPPPPMMVPPLPAEDPSVRRTLRERIDLHTGPGTCGERCHGGLINPIGFAFEHYDAIGRYRDTDNGLPVDASAEYDFDGELVAYRDATELGAVMAEQPIAHRCYSQHWLSYLFSRPVASEDEALVRRITERSLTEDLSIRQLIVELVASAPFRTRAVGELEDVSDLEEAN